jgi:hypothetical protein
MPSSDPRAVAAYADARVDGSPPSLEGLLLLLPLRCCSEGSVFSEGLGYGVLFAVKILIGPPVSMGVIGPPVSMGVIGPPVSVGVI